MLAARFVRQWFELPGAGAGRAADLLAQAADLHAALLVKALEALKRRDPGSVVALESLVGLLTGPVPIEIQGRWLNHPLLVEALHELASDIPELQSWDSCVIPVSSLDAAAPVPIGAARLGNVILPRLLERVPDWQGTLAVASDGYGYLHLADCPWSLTIAQRHEGQLVPLANTALQFVLDDSWASLRLADSPADPLLVLRRHELRWLVLGRCADAWEPTLLRRNSAFRVRLQYAATLDGSGVEYEPVGYEPQSAEHLATTGAIVQAVLAALAQHSPGIHAELAAFIRCIRGFDLPPTARGTIGSFSTPLRPGVMNFNVDYDECDRPRLDPYCFTWIGHELGHTKNYVIDDVAFLHGCRFLDNAHETRWVPRYGRDLALRTLFQVPYVHLYEAVVLADFAEHGFRGLPWTVEVDPLAIGDDLLAEIDEALALLQQAALLTPLGRAVLSRQRELADRVARRWRRIRRAA